MADEDVTGGGEPATGTEPASPPAGEGEVLDLEQAAEQIDADLLATLGKTPPPAAKGESPDGGPPTPPADSVEEFIKKNYGGDRNAFLHAQYASREENKRLRERLDEIERQQRQPREPVRAGDDEAAFKEARAANPEIRALDQEIKVIDDERKEHVQTISQIAARANQIATEMKALTAQHVKAEPEEKASIGTQIAELRAELLMLDQDYKLSNAEIRRVDTDKRRVQRELIRAEADLKDSIAYERQRAQDDEVDREMTKEQFDASVNFYFEQLGIDGESKQGKYLRTSCRSNLRDHLLSLGADSYGLDRAQIHAAVGQLLSEAVSALDIKPSKKIPKTPTPRPMVIPRTPPPVVRSPASTTSQSALESALDNPNLTLKQKADIARKRATAVFAAAARVGERSRIPS